MTWKAAMQKFLVDRGMFPEQAADALAPLVADPEHAMAGRWDDDVTGYPQVMHAVMQLEARQAAVAWIDTHLPKAWYRSVFASSTAAAEKRETA